MPIPRSARYALLCLPLLAACSASSPLYTKPTVALPQTYSDGPWRAAQPKDTVARGQWWLIYADPALNALEASALQENFNLKAAMSRVDQAKALVAGADAAFMPLATLNPGATRTRTSANRPYASPTSALPSTVQNDFIPSASVRWETDLSGRLSSTEQAAQAGLEQSEADRESVRLALTSNIALNYFGLRALEADLAWLQQLAEQETRALQMIERRAALGQANALDVVPIDAQLKSTGVQIESLRNQQQSLRNALATLTNTTPQDFKLAEGSLPSALHAIRAGVPTDLLERRPDIASSERAVAAQNAQIGIAESARYPSLILSGSLGSEGRALPLLLDAPSAIWAFGVSVSQVLFDGGRIQSTIDAAKASHEAAVATYRSTVINAVNEVETALYATEALRKSWREQQNLVATEAKQFALVKQKHLLGQATLYDEVFAEETLSSAKRIETQLYAQRVLAEIYLIKALGGLWSDPANP